MPARSSLLVCTLLGILVLAACDRRPPAPRRPRAIVDLSPLLDERTLELQYGRKAATFFGLDLRLEAEPVVPEDPLRTYGFAYYRLLSHAGAHLDAPSRLLKNGARPAEVPLERLFGWTRVLDLRWHDRNSPITVTDLENYRVRENEIIVLHVGYEPPADDEWPRYAYLSEPAAHWLAEKNIRALATDMPSISDLRTSAEEMEKGSPPQKIWPAHLPFFERGIPVLEGLVHLEQLIGERRIYLAAFPLAVLDRSGAPVRAVALLYD
ncbi:MAG: cyclase [Candidatus Binatia bacterium]|nr:MAG: cyclase [Candidatus Binatia bacterium]